MALFIMCALCYFYSHTGSPAAMNITTNDYSIDFISRGFSKEHDQLIHEYNGNCKELDVIIRYLNTEMEKVAKKIMSKMNDKSRR